MFNATVILIPAYNPTASLVDLATALAARGFDKIVIVDDGSTATENFERARSATSAHVLRHAHNQGKGAALKTGFAFISETFGGEAQSIITVDADGQHLCDDVVRIAKAGSAAPDSLILGVRDFQQSVPVRSKFGNYLTRLVLQQAKNIRLSDTQTGLRAIPLSFAMKCCELTSNRYEFELESIVLANRETIVLQELPISTVYIDNNVSSHFRPVVDSMRVYAVFARFISVSFASFLIDITAFAIAYAISSNVYTSTYLARSVSATLNFLGNKIFVFKSHDRMRAVLEASGYVLLVVAMATLSAYLVGRLHALTTSNIILVKVAVDACLFFASFLTQRHLLFLPRRLPTE